MQPELYSLTFSPLAICLLSAMLICMATLATILWPKLVRVRHRVSMDDEAPLPATGYPSVSVIVYSQADGTNLRTLLPQILQQDYPAPIEVIVVNDESQDDTETIVSQLELQYSNLYMTFAPDKSRNLSRRKLAITLGIKAARYDALLLTCGNCRIDSPNWMKRMMRHISAGAEVVIGYAKPVGPDGEPDEDSRRRRRSFDFTWHAVRYLSSAICHRPLIATGFNLAYTRRLFFAHKGFSQTLNLKFGDDDIFLREIANRHNTAVEISHEARVDSLMHQPAQMHDTLRLRRDFTSKYLARRAFRSMALTSILWWAWPLAGIAASLIGLPSLIPAAISLILALTFSFIHMSQWRRTASALGQRPLYWTVPWLSWSRPFRTLRYRILGRRDRSQNLTHVI